MSSKAIGAALAVGAMLTGPRGEAAEGGFSFFLPGTVGDIAIAKAPEPGWLVANTLFFQRGDADASVLQGNVNLGLDFTMILDIVSATYTFEDKILEASVTVGGAIPFGYAGLEATLTGPRGGAVNVDGDTFNIGDIALIPLQLNWDVGDFSFRFAELIYAPTGAYDANKAVNLGLNRWGFDTTFAATYLNLETGTEVSVAPGILFNTTNKDTNYRTGTEFHLDFTVNQFLSETFALGLRGYYYKQISGDSGAGARLGEFKGEAFGIGPGAVWIPEIAGGNLTVMAKWIHDLSASNRFGSDYGTVIIAWTF